VCKFSPKAMDNKKLQAADFIPSCRVTNIKLYTSWCF